MSKKLKLIPKFKSEAEERRFWETHNTTEYFDSAKTVRVRFPNLKPSTRSISLRLPLSLLEAIRIEANKRDVPYQSLIKVWLSERLKQRTPRIKSESAFRHARAVKAVVSMQRSSVDQGTDKISMEEIDAEIKAVRKKRAR
jgi:predicted DNA binding CopG/RHH family protein